MSLAQDFLDHGALRLVLREDDQFGRCVKDTDAWVRQSLLLPSHHEDPNRCAERYTFDVDVHDLVRSWIDSGNLPEPLLRETARLPLSPCWFECPCTYEDGTRGQMGLLVHQKRKEHVLEKPEVILAAVANSPVLRRPQVFALVGFEPFPWARSTVVTMRPYWSGSRLFSEMNEKDHEELNKLIYDLLDFLFVVNTPRVCEVRSVEWDKKKQRARKKTGKSPLVELKRTTVLIGQPAVRYESNRPPGEIAQPGARRRYHRVMPFFRTYRKGREAPKVSLVPEFWRGDRSRGIILHERIVKVREN